MTLLAGLIHTLKASTSVNAYTSNRIHAHHVPETSYPPWLLLLRDAREEPLTMDGARGLVKTSVSIEVATTAPDTADQLADRLANLLHGYRGAIGSGSTAAATALGIFVDDVDQDYIYSGAYDDAGTYLTAKRLTVWHTS